MNVSCPACETTYRINPRKVPEGGVRARCTECGNVFPVVARVAELAGVAAESAPSRPGPAAPGVFGSADPDAKARRLARALVSDIVVYHPDRRTRSLAAGTLRQEFWEEIQKSWEEYASQVGGALARDTTHFRDALNEILAGGERVF